MKTFGLLALAVIAFFIFSNIMIHVAIKTTYAPIESYITVRDKIKVEIDTAKATYVNGYVGGKVTNEGEEQKEAYVKIELCSKRDMLLGTKYVKIENWKQGETKEFEMGFKLTDVEYCKVSVIDEIPEQTTDEDFFSIHLTFTRIMSTVIMLCLFG